ncbi:hypothetical protein HJG60_011569 [Phyllostomus discolor]|uniref:Uncharacterized protein n=1 Tax=Phyllostomus discolor TaxID=89673 RepID=A0A833ZW03_9CHIR|nr:hypothetical protein HJG60_011569 [Phyllostomus discolor]
MQPLTHPLPHLEVTCSSPAAQGSLPQTDVSLAGGIFSGCGRMGYVNGMSKNATELTPRRGGTRDRSWWVIHAPAPSPLAHLISRRVPRGKRRRRLPTLAPAHSFSLYWHPSFPGCHLPLPGLWKPLFKYTAGAQILVPASALGGTQTKTLLCS